VRFEWNGWVERSFSGPTFFFHYWGFEWVEPLSVPAMHALFAVMIVSSICIALGLAYRVATVAYFLTFTYVELSVQTAAPALYWPMFASVFLFNTAFAIDTFFHTAPRNPEPKKGPWRPWPSSLNW